jgi:hypothetical protein
MLLGHIRGGGDLDTNCDIIMMDKTQVKLSEVCYAIR